MDLSLKKKAMQLDRIIRSTTMQFTFPNAYGQKFEIDLSKAQMWIYSSVYSKYYFQLRTIDGKLIEKSASLGKFILPYKDTMGEFETVNVNGRYLRLLNLKDLDNKIIIQVAYNVENERSILLKFEITVFLSLLFILLTSAVIGFFVSNNALSPLYEIDNQIRSITEQSLDKRLSLDNPPEELKDLVDSFNMLLERLDRAFKREKRFISDVSHELKTPISVIQMQCDLALRKPRREEDYKKALKLIKDTVSMMGTLIDKMLMLSKLDSLNIEAYRKIDLREIITKSIELLRFKAKEKDIKIELKGDITCSVRGDGILLEELFSNIIDNAIKYNRPSGYVYIEINEDKNTCKITIKDTGIGIERDELDRIFDEFYRVDKSRSKETEGFGLGLSIAKKILSLHNGKIHLESTPSEGTTVTITLKKAKS